MTMSSQLRVWKAHELRYTPIGEGGMVFCNPIEPGLSRIHAGYLDVHGGSLQWTREGDEVIFVLSGQIEITCGNDVYKLQPGDIIFLPDGASLRMTGTEDARIAYVSHI